MNTSSDLKYAQNMKNMCMGFVILCITLVIVAVLFANIWTVLSGIVSCALAIHAYIHWRRKYIILKNQK